MSRWTKVAIATAALVLALPLSAVPPLHADEGLGRAATPAEIAAWDIDVRPDFQGLPEGSGSVDEGEELWESTCAVCHGSFGESTEFFTPLIGGTTQEDIESGRVASLTDPTQTARTTIMKVPTVSTLWDYIHRAMPWDNPKSLSADEVYAVVAYLLNLADIVDFDYTLSQDTMAEVQERMPNRNGLEFWEGLWTVEGEPDVHNTACMEDCAEEVEVTSGLPASARDANGDYAAQMRIVGPTRGANAFEPPLTGSVEENAEAVRAHARSTLESAEAPNGAAEENGAMAADSAAVVGMLEDNGCIACHARERKLIGPSYLDVRDKYAEDEDALPKLITSIREGSKGVWGPAPMPPHPHLDEDDAAAIVEWILEGAEGML